MRKARWFLRSHSVARDAAMGRVSTSKSPIARHEIPLVKRTWRPWIKPGPVLNYAKGGAAPNPWRGRGFGFALKESSPGRCPMIPGVSAID
jgi:hypothetical protein